MEILVKVGSKFPDINDPQHYSDYRDGHIISIRQDGYYTDMMSRKHHAVIQLPDIDFWQARGSRDWKTNNHNLFELKKYYVRPENNGKYPWELPDNYQRPSRPKQFRNYFIDFTWLLENKYISLSQFESVYDKSKKHIPIVLHGVSLDEIIRVENTHIRLSSEKDQSTGTIASGTYSIGSGQAYVDVEAFIADFAATLTGDLTGEQITGETAFSGVNIISVNTSTFTLTITAAAGAEHNGGAYGSGARMNFGTADNLQIDGSSTKNVEISKLAMDASGSNNEGLILYDGGDTGLILINRMLIAGDVDARTGIWVYPELTNLRITNSIIYGFSNSAGTYGQGIRWQHQNSVAHVIYNNTIAKCYRGIHSEDATAGSETCVMKNNMCQGNTTDYLNDGAGYGTTGTNVSEDATSPDAAYRSKDLHTNTIFLDYANNDYRLNPEGNATNLAVADDGEDLSGTFTDDVIGTTREIWYIGAYELEQTSSSSSSSSGSSSFSSSSSSESVSSSSSSESVSSSSSSESVSSSSSSESTSNSSSSSSESTSNSSSSESVSSSSSSESTSNSSSSSSESTSNSSSSESVSSSSESSSNSSSSSESTSFSSSSSSNSSSSSSMSRSSSSSSSSSFSSSSSSSQSETSASSSSSSSSQQAAVATDTAIRVAWSGSYQDFDKFEVKAVRLDRVQGIDRFWKQTGYVQQYRLGKQYRRVTVVLDGSYSKNTLGKAETVWNQVDSYYQPKQLQLFYKWQIDSTANIMCQMDRNQMKWPYVAGYQSAQDITMVFIENSSLT